MKRDFLQIFVTLVTLVSLVTGFLHEISSKIGEAFMKIAEKM
jgi:hypothetical protein